MVETKERPILFSGPMVRAILEGRIVFNNEALAEAFRSGMTIKEIADQCGCSTHPVGKALRSLGLRRAPKRRAGVGAGHANPAWKGGRRVRNDGYIAVWTTDGERLEHRLVMEVHLGRKLQSCEVVHCKESICLPGDCGSFIPDFGNRWCEINGPDSWAANPWVFVIEFKRLKQDHAA